MLLTYIHKYVYFRVYFMVNLLELERKYLGFRDYLDDLNISSFICAPFIRYTKLTNFATYIFILLSEEERKAKFLSAKDFGKLYILLSFFILIIE